MGQPKYDGKFSQATASFFTYKIRYNCVHKGDTIALTQSVLCIILDTQLL